MTPERPVERRAAGTSLAERATESGQRASPAAMTANGFGYGSRPVYLDRAVYTTITMMSVLIAYDGWQNLKFWPPQPRSQLTPAKWRARRLKMLSSTFPGLGIPQSLRRTLPARSPRQRSDHAGDPARPPAQTGSAEHGRLLASVPARSGAKGCWPATSPCGHDFPPTPLRPVRDEGRHPAGSAHTAAFPAPTPSKVA